MNFLKLLFAKLVVFSFNLLFKISNKFMKGRYLAKDHYYKMIFFQKLFKDYYVTITYDNPLSPDKQMKFRINLVDNSSQHYFNCQGQYEIKWIRLIHNLLPYYESFIDIGANFGIYAVTIAQAHPSKKIIAIEPLKRNSTILKENIKINNLPNCEIMEKAVSTKKGTLRFYINPIHDGGGSLIENEFYRTGNIVLNAKEYLEKHKGFNYYQEVESIGIDDIVTTDSIMKIDVEGTELDVLKSGNKTFKNGFCDIVVVEVLAGKTFYDVVKLMNKLNYECYNLGSKSPLKGTEKMDWFVFNLICVRKNCGRYKDIVNLITSNIDN